MNTDPVAFLGRLLPEQPTQALPGTPEKLQVLADRFARQELLFHPQDRLLPGGLD